MNKPSLQSNVLRNLIMAVVAFLIGFFVVLPQWHNHANLGARLSAAENQNIELNKSLASAESFLKSYDNHQADAITAGLALPVSDLGAANFVTSIGDLAQASGVALLNLQMEDPGNSDKTAPPHSIRSQKINLIASGSYPAFKDFALRLENHLRLVDISHITLRQDESGVLQYQVDLTTYYQK